MSTPGDDEIALTEELLRRHGLLPEIVPEPQVEPGTGARLARSITAVPHTTTRGHPARRRTVLILAAAVLAVAVVIVQTVRSTPGTAATTPRALTYSLADPTDLARAGTADTVLQQLATTAATGPAPAGTGDVQYVQTYGWTLAVQFSASASSQPVATSRVYPTMTDSWLAPDGSAQVTQARAGALTLDGRVTSGHDADTVDTDTVPAGTLNANLASTLTTDDPAALTAQLLALSSALPCTQDSRWHAQCLVEAVEQIYTSYVVTPQLAAALWSVLAAEPDLKDLGATHDRLGRSAHAVALASDPTDVTASQVTVLLVADDSGQLDGTETVALHDTVLDVTQPTVVSFTTWTITARVRDLGQHPNGQ